MDNFDILKKLRNNNKNITEDKVENSECEQQIKNVDEVTNNNLEKKQGYKEDDKTDICICKYCGKQIDSNFNFCQFCGRPSVENNNNNIIIIILLVSIIIITFFMFSPMTFDIQIMGISVESKISYDFITQKAKLKIGAFGFDREGVSPVDYVNIKYNVINNILLNNDKSLNIIEMISSQTNDEYCRLANSAWYNKALVEYSSLENQKNNFFFKNIFNSKKEKEEHFSDIVKQLDIAAENVSNTYYNSNQIINEEYVRKYVVDFNQLGFDITSTEGIYCFRPYYPYLIKTFGIPKIWKEYLELASARQNDFGEACCKLGVNDLVDVILRYDKFLQKYSDFIYKDMVKQEQNMYLYSYLHGFDNDLKFDTETNKIKKEYKQSIENFLKDYQNFSKYSLVNEYYLKLKKNNYKINDDISTWLWHKLY